MRGLRSSAILTTNIQSTNPAAISSKVGRPPKINRYRLDESHAAARNNVSSDDAEQTTVVFYGGGHPFSSPNHRKLEATHSAASSAQVGEGLLNAGFALAGLFSPVVSSVTTHRAFDRPFAICPKLQPPTPQAHIRVPAGITAFALIPLQHSLALAKAIQLPFQRFLRGDLSSRISNLGRLRGP